MLSHTAYSNRFRKGTDARRAEHRALAPSALPLSDTITRQAETPFNLTTGVSRSKLLHLNWVPKVAQYVVQKEHV